MGRLRGPSRERFEEVYSQGSRANGPNLRIHALAGTGQFGIATSRQIGNHPRRNLQKRRVREAAMGLDVSGLDVAVTVKPSAEEASLEQLKEELRNLVTEIRARWASGSGSD